MNAENLFEAIGLMNEEFLNACITVQEHRPKRIVWKTVLIAAIVSCLAVTAVAEVISELFGRTSKEQGEHISRWGTYRDERMSSSLDIYLTFPELHNAPQEIREYYAPTFYEKKNLWYCNTNEGDAIREFSVWWVLDERRTVTFNQWCCDDYNPAQPVDSLRGLAFTSVNHSTKTINHKSQEYFYLRVESFTEEYAGQIFDNNSYLYWTDGSYIFRLNFPNEMDVENAFEIVDSLEKITDVQSWLELGAEKRRERTENRWSIWQERLASDEPYESPKTFERADTELLEDGALKVSLLMHPVKEGAQFDKRLVYPRVFEGWEIEIMGFNTSDSEQDTAEDDLVDYTVCWKTAEYGENGEIWFRQRWRRNSLFVSGASYEFYVFDVGDPEKIQTQTIKWDDDHVFEVAFAQGKNGAPGAKYYFWGESYNVFSLRVPFDTPESKVREILDSIR